MPETPVSKKKFPSKRKGNTFENKIAKELGTWMFSDKHMLGRHPTSGAIKVVWTGDIVPQKQLPQKWTNWPFYIECKSGYTNNVCTLNNQTIVRTWLDKCLKESLNKIILLIINFKGYSSLLITNFQLKDTYPLLVLCHNEKFYFIYEFKDLLKLNFLKCFGWE